LDTFKQNTLNYAPQIKAMLNFSVKPEMGTQTDFELKYQVWNLEQHISRGLDWEILAERHDVTIDTISSDSVKYREPHLDVVKIEITRRNRLRENSVLPFLDIFSPGKPPRHQHRPPPLGEQHPPVRHHKGRKHAKGPGKIKPEVRRATQDVQIKGQWFRITYSRNIVATPHLKTIALMAIGTISLLILFTLFLGNRWQFNRIFRPFFQILNTVKEHDISQNAQAKIVDTDIDEFQVLQERLQFFIKASHQEYIRLKEFSENLSHELQTPIAIIKSKIDRLQQSNRLGEAEFLHLEEIQGVLQRAAQLNRTLLLFTRIENQEFREVKPVKLKDVIQRSLKAFGEMIDLKQLQLDVSASDTEVEGNPYLIELLFTNLIHNGIRHNDIGGSLSIRLDKQFVEISNTGPDPEFDPIAYFQRFRKSAKRKDSTGMGLSIVKQICEVSGFEIEYSFRNERHSMRIEFP
ncbi:MAG: HAMP domain-containing sensor histidine kinase, partial [Bacteroidota bacterium]